MRLISTFDTEKEAYQFYCFLLKENIPNTYEAFQDTEQNKKRYRIWIEEEDDWHRALEWLEQFQKNPHDPKFQDVPIPVVVASSTEKVASRSFRGTFPLHPLRIRLRKRPVALIFTPLLVAVCAFLFLWNDFQKETVLKKQGALAFQIGFTPLQKVLIFDFPKVFEYLEQLISVYPIDTFKDVKGLPEEAQHLFAQAEQIPSWKGLYAFIQTGYQQGWDVARQIPLFEKIRTGQIWRLLTPIFLHSDFLHILFNMGWAWILGKQMEERLRLWKILLFILIVGVISNVVQYLMSGPYFVGFSGVIVGMAGFIWVRQKKAPWEGYPLQRGTALFLLLFVLSMCALELVTFLLELLSIVQLDIHIANTAHVVGGLCGMALGRLSFFARGKG